MTANESVRAYWEDSWARVTETGLGDEERRYRLEPFIHSVAQFTRHRGADVLEVGVGSGIDHLQWARAGARCSGVDLTSEAISQTRTRLASEGLTSDLRCVDAETLPFGDASFDLVYSWGVIHHADHPEQIVGEIHRVLRPTGIFVGMLYERRSIVALKLWVKHGLLRLRPTRSLTDCLAHHMESPGTKAYTPGEIRQLFDGFTAVETEHFVTPYDRSRLPRWLGAAIPARLGWFVAIRARR